MSIHLHRIYLALWLSLLASLPFADLAAMPSSTSQVSSSDSKPPRSAHTALGAGQTLPQGIARTRVVYKSIERRSGFDETGRKEELGYHFRTDVVAPVFEYGLSDRFTLQFMIPVVVNNYGGLDGDKFRKSKLYRERFEAAERGTIDKMKSLSLCDEEELCRQWLYDGFSFPLNAPVPLPTGEEVYFQSDIEVLKSIDSMIVTAASPSHGMTGLSDIELGGLYNFLRSKSWIISVGLGLRLPTASYTDVPFPRYRPTGAGLLDIAGRLNLDFSPFEGLWLSWQEQLETALTSSERSRSSLYDNQRFNTAEPTDGIPNKQEFSKRGLGRSGFVQAQFGAGVVHRYLAPIAVHGAYAYLSERPEYLDDELKSERARTDSLVYGASADGRNLGLPISVGFSRSLPLSGQDVAAAASSWTVEFKGYLKF